MPDMRSKVNVNDISMQGWVGSGDSLSTFSAACTSPMSSFTIEADITGCSVSVVVPSNGSTIIAIATVDMTIATSGSSFSCFFNWNTTDQPGDCLFVNPGSTVTNRITAGQSWVVTGVSAGTFTAKLRASCTTSNASNTIHSGNTTLIILVIGGS